MAQVPFRVRAKCILPFDELREHIHDAVSRNLPLFVPFKGEHQLEAVLVGSGPSVKDQVNKLRRMAKQPERFRVFGIKGAHDFLLKNKITPDYGVAVDPQEKIADENFLRKAPEGKSVVYFIASQCHPAVFDALKDRDVVLWHLQTKSLLDYAREPQSPVAKHFMVPGGSTSGLRSIVLAHFMGFRAFHLFGFDSCLSGKLRKITGEVYEKDDTVELNVAGRQFIADKAMASQATEFQDIVKQFPGSTFKAYGEGLLQTIVRERYRQGAPDSVV